MKPNSSDAQSDSVWPSAAQSTLSARSDFRIRRVRVEHRNDRAVEAHVQDAAVGQADLVLADGELAGRVERRADVLDDDVRDVVIREREVIRLAVDDEVRAELGARRRGAADRECLVEAELLRDVAEVVAHLDHRGDEVRREVEDLRVDVRGDRRRAEALHRALHGATDAAVRQLVDELLDEPLARIVGLVGRRDDVVDDRAGGAGNVRSDVERRRHLVGAIGVQVADVIAAGVVTAVAAVIAAVVATAATVGGIGRTACCRDKQNRSEEAGRLHDQT
ncbi:MAG: hypothetical protein QM831_27290 [Kofleriaceae bacterium]